LYPWAGFEPLYIYICLLLLSHILMAFQTSMIFFHLEKKRTEKKKTLEPIDINCINRKDISQTIKSQIQYTNLQ